MKQLRDIDNTPTLYAKGDRVLVNHWWQKPKNGTDMSILLRQDEFYEGTITDIGYSTFNQVYDWYVISLDNGELVESWWMTTYKIVKKLELAEPNGLPSQEA